MAEAQHVLVLGAKGLGRTVAEHLIGLGWTATGVSRTQATADTCINHDRKFSKDNAGVTISFAASS